MGFLFVSDPVAPCGADGNGLCSQCRGFKDLM